MLNRVDSRPVYANNSLLVRADTVADDQGRTSVRGVVEAPDMTVYLARDTAGRVLVSTATELYPGVGPRLCLPSHIIETAQEGTPTRTDRTRERSSVDWLGGMGLTTEHPVRTVTLEALPHLTELWCRVLVADPVVEVDPDTRGRRNLPSVWLSEEEINQAVADGRLRDAMSLAALGLLGRR